MQARRSRAFAPAAISSFFRIYDEALSRGFRDLSMVGATGGGFTLSKGVHTRATVILDSPPSVETAVNGDRSYSATTTRRAVSLLLEALHEDARVEIEQDVEVPIGYGFGTSAASALSAVLAVSSALGSRLSKEDVASYAHAADIICQTGLGTVSSIYDHAGAGLIARPGGPGVAEVLNVDVPRGLKVVTASLAPYRKSDLLSSAPMRARVNALGSEALRRASSLTLEGLLRAGEVFTEGLGLASGDLRRLMNAAMAGGALGASQNMIGHAMHAVVWEDDVEAVASVLETDRLSPSVDVFSIGEDAARVLETELVDYPRTKSSLV